MLPIWTKLSHMQQTEWGIDPDIKVDFTDSDIKNGIDTIIEAALKILTKKN